MFRIDDQLSNHRLNDAYIAIERTTKKAAEECHPEIEGEAKHKERGNGTKATHYEYWLAT